MITLEQVLLLEQKVESAVEKISQLQAENDALRTKCSELTNSLSSKTELLSSLEQDQSKIENGILKALDRLNAIENSVRKAGSAASSAKQQTAEKSAVEKPAASRAAPQTAAPSDAGQFDIF